VAGGGLLRESSGTMGSKGRPYRTLRIDGFDVLVGRGADENDHLTFEVAEPRDVWLHVAGGTPGSHVVVRNPQGGELPRDVLEGAAAAAAWYSRSRGAAKAEVHYCRAADVSKPRGAPAGLVQLSRWKSVKVKPAVPAGQAGDLPEGPGRPGKE
jgi:predicted ribosome quality control (RQC) complex YloA/Tae2 family protein